VKPCMPCASASLSQRYSPLFQTGSMRLIL
jgi:hypothetical protein